MLLLAISSILSCFDKFFSESYTGLSDIWDLFIFVFIGIFFFNPNFKRSFLVEWWGCISNEFFKDFD